MCLELFVNDRIWEPGTGVWQQLGAIACSAHVCEAAFELDATVPAGLYRAGVNVHFENGAVLHWYQQPLLTIEVA